MELRYTQKDLASRLDVDPGSIYKYENEKMTPGLKVLDKMYKLCEQESLNEPIKLINNFDVKKEETDMDARYLIELQRDKITYQEEEISKLKKQIQAKEAESTHWDMLEFDYFVETKIYLKNMIFGRTINEVTNLELQSQKLGYTVDELKELWDVGNSYMFDSELPLKKILDYETLKDINEKTRTFPAIFNTLKNIVGHHYIPMPVVYLHKNDNKVPAISYNKIKWSEMKVYSKVEYIKV